MKVSEFLIKTLKLEFSEEEIHRAIGLLSTNNANLSMGDGFGKGAGLYPTYSRINHSCLCNTRTLKYKDNRYESQEQLSFAACTIVPNF